jgi:hypothetical protein
MLILAAASRLRRLRRALRFSGPEYIVVVAATKPCASGAATTVESSRGSRTAEANPDVGRYDGRAGARRCRAEKNGCGP